MLVVVVDVVVVPGTVVVVVDDVVVVAGIVVVAGAVVVVVEGGVGLLLPQFMLRIVIPAIAAQDNTRAIVGDKLDAFMLILPQTPCSSAKEVL